MQETLSQTIRKQLFERQDLKYREFQSALMPTVDKETVIGVRIPFLRKLAKDYAKRDVTEFFADLPHTYYEENNLHGFILSEHRDFQQVVSELNAFLPYIDNWATCDTVRPRCFAKHKQALLPHIQVWLSSDKTYTVRYAIGMLMSHFLDESFNPRYLENVARIESEEYYVDMMISWYFATALAKQWNATIPYLEEKRLSAWVHNKTIQKAIESYRISPEQKAYLKTMKR